MPVTIFRIDSYLLYIFINIIYYQMEDERRRLPNRIAAPAFNQEQVRELNVAFYNRSKVGKIIAFFQKYRKVILSVII